MSPHDIAGPPDQSSPNSGNKCRLARPPNAAKFRHPPTRNVRDIRCRKFVLPEKWTKVHQNSRRPATHRRPYHAKFHRVRPKDVREKLYNFLHPSVLWCPRGNSCVKVHQSSLGHHVHQDPLYQSATFRPVLKTSIRDTCCQSSSILL